MPETLATFGNVQPQLQPHMVEAIVPFSCIEADSVLLPSNGDRHELRGEDGRRQWSETHRVRVVFTRVGAHNLSS